MTEIPGTVLQLCVCREGDCWCVATIEMGIGEALKGSSWECPDCRIGIHVTRDRRHHRTPRFAETPADVERETVWADTLEP